jgi:hypothetical protein
MQGLNFRGEWSRVLWSKSSPQEGEPTCLCSYCGALIPEDTIALRCWRGEGEQMEEARFCDDCSEACFGILKIDEPEDVDDEYPL